MADGFLADTRGADRSSEVPVTCDALVIGAGAAGLMAAATAARGGARVVVLDHNTEPGRKILISGGGRCNFTHLDSRPECFLSSNRHFVRSALARFTPHDFLKLVECYRIAWHEKTPGQLFCNGPARQIVDMLLAELRTGGADLVLGVRIDTVQRDERGVFCVRASGRVWHAGAVVLASGGLSIPKLGATDLALRMARQFGLRIVPTAPALVPLCLADAEAGLSGVSLPVRTIVRNDRTGRSGVRFDDGLVFTHRGLSGPAILQASSYWHVKDAVALDLAPGRDVLSHFLAVKAVRPRAKMLALLDFLPARLARHLVQTSVLPSSVSLSFETELANVPDRVLRALSRRVSAWSVVPSGTEGYAKAEVMRGGIDTRDLSSQTMEARAVSGLFAIGEAVDVTGWLGGHNFQWAWSSGVAAGSALAGRVLAGRADPVRVGSIRAGRVCATDTRDAHRSRDVYTQDD